VWAPYGMIIPRSFDKGAYLRSLQSGRHERYELRVSVNATSQNITKNYTDIFMKKTKHALWFVSHCKTQSKRELYVEKMKNVTQIDIFGKCGSKRIQSNVTFDTAYKFYFAFENNMCADYITEKFFAWYSKDIILVAYGGANYSRFVPDGTYINAADFPTPKELALYLNKLGSDRERYIGYLKRKDQYQVITEQESVQNAFCAMCWRLNQPQEFPKWQTDMTSFWMETCRKPKMP